MEFYIYCLGNVCLGVLLLHHSTDNSEIISFILSADLQDQDEAEI